MIGNEHKSKQVEHTYLPRLHESNAYIERIIPPSEIIVLYFVLYFKFDFYKNFIVVIKFNECQDGSPSW